MTVEVSPDKSAWATVGGISQFDIAPGAADSGKTYPMVGTGRYVRITCTANWGNTVYTSFSEIRFTGIAL